MWGVLGWIHFFIIRLQSVLESLVEYPLELNLCRSNVSRKSLAASAPGKKSSPTMSQVDSSSDGNAGVVSPRQPTSNSSPIPQPPPTPMAGQGRLLEEKNDKISKEKQKFFRSSAFNTEHNKLKRVGGSEKPRSPQISPRSSKPEIVKTPKKLLHPNRKDTISSSSSSSSESSSSSSETSSSEDEKENSSSESSDSSSSEDEEPPTRAPTLKSKPPFTCDLTEDKPWGFAAAAAKLTVESSPFFSNITSTFGATLPKLDLSDKPTFGLHIQPAASPLGKKKKKQKEKKIFENCENKEKQKEKPGSGQLKGLFDGLSHFFSAPGNSRSKPGAPMPNYAPDRRKRTHEENKEPTKEVSSKDINSIKAKPNSKTPKLEIRDVSPCNKETTKEEPKDSPRIPKPGIFTPSDESLFSNEKPPKMTPSNLVKTAVNSKRHEHERRKLKGADGMSIIKSATDPPGEQQTRKKHSTSQRDPEPAKSNQSTPVSNKSSSNPKSNPRACTSATTTNTTTTPRATPCSTRKGKSLPHPFTILTSTMHPFAETPSNLILAHHRGCVGGVVWYGLMCAYACL